MNVRVYISSQCEEGVSPRLEDICLRYIRWVEIPVALLGVSWYAWMRCE